MCLGRQGIVMLFQVIKLIRPGMARNQYSVVMTGTCDVIQKKRQKLSGRSVNDRLGIYLFGMKII